VGVFNRGRPIHKANIQTITPDPLRGTILEKGCNVMQSVSTTQH